MGNGGKGFSILLRKSLGVGKGWKNSQQIPSKSGNEKLDFVGEMEGGWEFPAFSRGERPVDEFAIADCGLQIMGEAFGNVWDVQKGDFVIKLSIHV